MEPVKISSHPTSKPEAPVKSRKIADSVKAVLDKGADSGNADLPFTSQINSFKANRSHSSAGGGRIRSAVANLLHDN